MPSVEILTLRNPRALELPDIDQLLTEAFKNVTRQNARQKLANSISEPDNACFIARANGTWRGMAWVQAPSTDDGKTALVLHFFCRGGHVMREALVKAIVEFARARGAETLFTWDINRRPRSFTKLFKSAGPAKEVTRAYEFDLNEAKY